MHRWRSLLHGPTFRFQDSRFSFAILRLLKKETFIVTLRLIVVHCHSFAHSIKVLWYSEIGDILRRGNRGFTPRALVLPFFNLSWWHLCSSSIVHSAGLKLVSASHDLYMSPSVWNTCCMWGVVMPPWYATRTSCALFVLVLYAYSWTDCTFNFGNITFFFSASCLMFASSTWVFARLSVGCVSASYNVTPLARRFFHVVCRNVQELLKAAPYKRKMTVQIVLPQLCFGEQPFFCSEPALIPTPPERLCLCTPVSLVSSHYEGNLIERIEIGTLIRYDPYCL